MSRRSRKARWPVVLLLLAVGFFMRGRSNSAPSPSSTTPSPQSAEQPNVRSIQPPVQISKPEPTKVQPAHHEAERQLHLRVVGVHDGDTLTGLDDTKNQHKVRLDAIDAPELGQPFGQASKKALSEKVFGKDVVVVVKTREKYGRTVGHVLIDGRDVNLEMLEEGMAWHYVKYDKNARLSRAEEEARTAGRGLWQDRAPVPPWDWRKAKREKR
jgi:endonuclease YncB( thermonuclease family)